MRISKFKYFIVFLKLTQFRETLYFATLHSSCGPKQILEVEEDFSSPDTHSIKIMCTNKIQCFGYNFGIIQNSMHLVFIIFVLKLFLLVGVMVYWILKQVFIRLFIFFFLMFIKQIRVSVIVKLEAYSLCT